jgi:hypothetical protein
MFVLLEGSLISTEELCQSDHRAFGHIPDQGPSPPNTQFGQALGIILVVPNLFQLRMMEATVFLGTFNAAEMFWYPFPRSVSRHNPVSELSDNSFNIMACFFL